MTIDVEGNQRAKSGQSLEDAIVDALDLKGTLDVVELVSIVREPPSVVESALSGLVETKQVEVTEKVDDLPVYRLTRPLHSGFYRR
jgi:hypothetical protein